MALPQVSPGHGQLQKIPTFVYVSFKKTQIKGLLALMFIDQGNICLSSGTSRELATVTH